MKTCVSCYTGTLPAQMCKLISARCDDRMIPLVSINDNSDAKLVSEAEQVDLCFTWSDSPEDTISRADAQLLRCLVTKLNAQPSLKSIIFRLSVKS